METYGLPADYKINPVNITMDHGSGFYWDPSRVRKSASHQFAVYEWAAGLIRRNGIKIIADVGCGFAAKLDRLRSSFPDRSFWGIDQPNAIALCQDHYQDIQWLGVDLESNPETPPMPAGLSISSDVIEHLQNPDILLDYLRRATEPGGLILISTPERRSLRGADCLSSPNPYHVREWTREEFAAYLKSRNMNIIDHRVLPAMRCEANAFYLRKFIRRFLVGQSMRYNQAVLIKNG
ncbi:MAG TPA: class I SAM-dependent methyltransferase [Micavibrio sp.]